MKMVILCAPLSYSPLPPQEQSFCTIEECPGCKTKIWVSQKKRFLREKEGAEILCGNCVIEKYGSDIELIDISKLN